MIVHSVCPSTPACDASEHMIVHPVCPATLACLLNLSSQQHVDDDLLWIFLSNSYKMACKALNLFLKIMFPSVCHCVLQNCIPFFKCLELLTGALDKYNIYLFTSNSTEDFELNQYQNFQLILPMRFHFMRYFVNSITFRVSHRLLYCVFIEADFEK